jgi:hypothetical protein
MEIRIIYEFWCVWAVTYYITGALGKASAERSFP